MYLYLNMSKVHTGVAIKFPYKISYYHAKMNMFIFYLTKKSLFLNSILENAS